MRLYDICHAPLTTSFGSTVFTFSKVEGNVFATVRLLVHFVSNVKNGKT